MARRDRKRKRRDGASNPGPSPTEPHRENIPGELDHASGDVEEFEAGIVSGAEGEALESVSEADLAAAADEAVGRPSKAAAGRAVPGQPTAKGFARMFAFFRASWAELQRVQWPDRRQVAQATAVVLGFVIIAGAYLGLADAAAQKVIDLIL
jgi:preprotein translocase subunit SecE